MGSSDASGLIGDPADATKLIRVTQETQPDEIYNPGVEKRCRFYQASTSLLFGNAPESPQNENAPFAPCNPHAAAELYAYWTTRNHREAYGIDIPCGTGAMPGTTPGPCGSCSCGTSSATT